MGPERIKRIRTLLGWSQERLARELGVSFSTVNRWERGRTRPSPMASAGLERLSVSGKADAPVGKRKTFRLDVRCPILVERSLESGAGESSRRFSSFGATTENLSFSGLMFKDPAGLSQGERLCIGLDCGDRTGEGRGCIRAPSEVVWTRGRGSEKRVGVRFETPMPEEVSRVMNALLH